MREFNRSIAKNLAGNEFQISNTFFVDVSFRFYGGVKYVDGNLWAYGLIKLKQSEIPQANGNSIYLVDIYLVFIYLFSRTCIGKRRSTELCK